MAAALGLALMIAGVAAYLGDDVEIRETIIEAQGCRVPASIYEPHGAKRGDAVIFHGLAANRALMSTLARALARKSVRAYALDLNGHGDNTDSFTFAAAERCAAAAVQKLAADGEIRAEHTVIIGHSMGGDVALRLADAFAASATVAISPGPLVRMPAPLERLRIYAKPERLPANLLQQAAQFDLPLFAWSAEELTQQAGGVRVSEEDFRAGGARGITVVPWTTHTALVFDRVAIEQILQWIRRAWWEASVDAAAAEPRGQVAAWQGRALLRIALPVGVVLLFPAALRWIARVVPAGRDEAAALEFHGAWLTRWAAAAIFSAVILRVASPLAFLRLVTGAYLAAFLLITALGFLALSRPHGQAVRELLRKACDDWRASGLSGIAAGALMLALALATRRELGDLWMNAERWWRFAALAPLLLPYCFAEEAILGPVRASGARLRRRWRDYFVLRGVMWLAMMAGVLLLRSQEILVLVMGLVFIVFSIAQRLGADAVSRRFASAPSGAIFSAILAAWFLAAVFPVL